MCQNRQPMSPERRAEGERELVRKEADADDRAARQEYLFTPPAPVIAFLRRSLVDQRDLPLAYLLWDMCVTTVPAAAALWAWPCRSHLVGAVYLLATYAAYLQRFMLTLHFSEHRPLFKPGREGCSGVGRGVDGMWERKGRGTSCRPRQGTPTSPVVPGRPSHCQPIRAAHPDAPNAGWRALNLVCPYLLAPMVGVPPGMYTLHHCIMHHGGGNAWGQDASSTERFQRDNPWHFLMCGGWAAVECGMCVDVFSFLFLFLVFLFFFEGGERTWSGRREKKGLGWPANLVSWMAGGAGPEDGGASTGAGRRLV